MTETSQPSGEPLAMVKGQPLLEPPNDLYIPPEALEVVLESFHGPLDLLLYLIKRNNLDILDIPIATITEQYIQYIGMLEARKLELAAEYLVMAAVLAEIKSRMLLPRPPSEDEEQDPRAELVRRLLEYEQFKQAAERLDELPRLERDNEVAQAVCEQIERLRPAPNIGLDDIAQALAQVLERAKMYEHHLVAPEALSVRERMTLVTNALIADEFIEFAQLFRPQEGRMGVIVTLLALLELLRDAIVELVQSEPFAPIYVRPAGARS